MSRANSKTERAKVKPAAAQPIRSKADVRALIDYYLNKGQLRNYVLISMSIYTALRISDLLRFKWQDVFDFKNNRVRKYVTLTEKKTGKSKIVALNEGCISALLTYMKGPTEIHPEDYLFANKRTKNPISRVQAYRIIRDAAEKLGFSERVSCHSLRKTFGYHAWKDGTSPAVIMEIYNHSSMAVTRRYLGVTQDDKNQAYLSLSFD